MQNPPQVTPEHHSAAEFSGPGARIASLARSHYENFPVGSLLLPRGTRRHLHRIYAFARTADDLADEHRDLEGLEALEAMLREHLAGTAEHPVQWLVDLATTVAERDLPPQLFFDLLTAFRQDLSVARYEEEALFAYCRLSADPVGRLVLRVSGQATPERDQWSDRICTALQLLNHLQDIGEDYAERDRIYFPTADLERFGVAETDLAADRASDGLRALVLHWTDRVAGMFAQGWPLIGQVRGRLRLELRAILWGAAAVLDAIRSRNGEVLSQHIRLPRRTRVRSVVRGLMRRRMPEAFESVGPGTAG